MNSHAIQISNSVESRTLVCLKRSPKPNIRILARKGTVGLFVLDGLHGSEISSTR